MESVFLFSMHLALFPPCMHSFSLSTWYEQNADHNLHPFELHSFILYYDKLQSTKNIPRDMQDRLHLAWDNIKTAQYKAHFYVDQH